MSAGEKLLRLWAKDAEAFCYDVFGAGYERETGKPFALDPWQQEFMAALSAGEQRIGLRAAKGPGKSAGEAMGGHWFNTTRPYANIAVLSVTGKNLEDNLWKELSVWYGRAPVLQNWFEVTGASIHRRGEPEISNRWFISPRSFPQNPDPSQQAATVAGLHGDHVAVFIDEGGDVPPGVLHAAEGIFANDVDAVLVIGGNCTAVDGALYDATVKRGHRYKVIRITGDPLDPNRSPRMDLKYCEQLIADYGREDPVVMINVLGEFPSGGVDKLLSPDDVTKAEGRVAPAFAVKSYPVIYGLDVARHGLDSSPLTKRQGPAAFAPTVYRIPDLMLLAEKVAEKLKGEEVDAVIIGATGIGWGCYDRLRQLMPGSLVIAVDEGSKALDEQRFHNRRTEMWRNGTEWLKREGSIPSDPELRADLLAPGCRQRFLRGRTAELLDPGDLIKAQLGRSPDKGTSLMLTFAAPVKKRQRDAVYAMAADLEKFDPYEHMRNMRRG